MRPTPVAHRRDPWPTGPVDVRLPDSVVASVDDVQATLLGAYLSAFDTCLHGKVRLAFAVTAALTATSRLCWTLNRTVEPAVVEHWARLVPWIVPSAHEAGSA